MWLVSWKNEDKKKEKTIEYLTKTSLSKGFPNDNTVIIWKKMIDKMLILMVLVAYEVYFGNMAEEEEKC